MQPQFLQKFPGRGMFRFFEIDAGTFAIPENSQRFEYAGLCLRGVAGLQRSEMRVERAGIPRRRIGKAHRSAGEGYHPAAARQLLKIDHEIKAGPGHFLIPAQLQVQIPELFFVHVPDLVQMRIAIKKGKTFFFREQVQFRVGPAPPEQFEGRRGEQNVAKLSELADEDSPRREGRKIDHADRGPTSSAMRRQVDALFSVYR